MNDRVKRAPVAVVAALAVFVLAVLTFGLVGIGISSPSPSSYGYDASEGATLVVSCEGIEDERKQMLLSCGTADLGDPHGYDDAATLSHASARSDAYRLAPSTPRPTYRWDSRPPSQIFDEGFEALGDDMDLLRHAEGYPNSGYVSTSTSPTVAPDFGPNLYEVRAPGGIDVNATLGPRSPYPNELQIAFLGRVQSCHIVGCTTGSGQWVPNPGYRGPR